ncbi:MAG: type II toxin-antitoxin system HicA family toxin [Solirubrobacteraceae bacterium]
MWENPATGERTTVPRHREIRTPTARGICRQLSVPVPSGR